ncbi:protein O-GlcNAc transferase [Azospirillaceae bacterium]
MTTLAEAYALALDHHRMGRWNDGLAVCRAILDVAPDNAGTWHLSALLAFQNDDRATALAHVRKALALAPDNPFFHNTFGEILRAGKSPEECVNAKEHYRAALMLRPDFPEALYNLGLTFLQEREIPQAKEHLERAASLAPEDVEIRVALGLCLLEMGQIQKAESHLHSALRHAPNLPEAWNNLGLVYQRQGRRDSAMVAYRRALALKPDFAEASNNLGALLQDRGRTLEALSYYKTALDLRPDFAEAHFNSGVALRDLGEMAGSLECFKKALSFRPDYPEALFALVMAELPLLYNAPEDISTARGRYAVALTMLERKVDAMIQQNNVAGLRALAVGVGAAQPFFLPYQAQDDCALQRRYGGVVHRLMARAFGVSSFSAPYLGKGRARVRVGFVSGHFRRHSVWKMPTRGWVEALDRNQFELIAYDVSPTEDAGAGALRALFDRYTPGPLSIEAWRAIISADAPDVLIYPELGMDPMALRLATQRLAPKQCVSWGHPETSGLPTIDYYLSSALMEPPEADAYYTEKLIRLPNLSLWLTPPLEDDAPDVADDVLMRSSRRREFGLRDDAIVYWCCQSLFKYLPQDDYIFPRIARLVGNCQFVFLHYLAGNVVNERFQARMERAFAAEGLSAAEYCRFLPRLSEAGFASVARLCDVLLDSLRWSGCNSVLESLTQGTPVVTLPGQFMRGRHAMAILQRMEMTETIAVSVGDYVEKARVLGENGGLRAEIRRKTRERICRLYRDGECVEALSTFLKESQ